MQIYDYLRNLSKKNIWDFLKYPNYIRSRDLRYSTLFATP